MQGKIKKYIYTQLGSETQSFNKGNFLQAFSIFNFQPYLNLVNIEKYRYTPSRLRMSSHRLEIEAGRWHRPNEKEMNQRKCKHCDTLEDEFHFLF